MAKLLRHVTLFLISLLVLSGCGTYPTPTPQPTTTLPPSLPSPTTAIAPPPLPTATTSLVGANISGLYDAGGFKLFVDCQGTGSAGTPTVIMDAGLGVDSGTWARVQPTVADFVRTCRYDRAGLGRSEKGPMPRTSQEIVKELHALLVSAGLKPPYVLVGASFGGLDVQLYSIQYPHEVAGMVLVDSLHPKFDERIEKLFTPEQVTERRAELSDNLEGIAFENILTSEQQVDAAGKLPDVPLMVLRHGRPFDFSAGWPADEVEKLWIELQTDLASRTSKGQLVLAERAGHRIQEMRPDLVIQAIKDVVNMAKTP